MLELRTPRMMNKTSQALLVPFAFALLTIAIIIKDDKNVIIKYGRKAKLKAAVTSPPTPMPPKIEKTIPIMETIRTTQLKILAMLYMIADALCILRILPSRIIYGIII